MFNMKSPLNDNSPSLVSVVELALARQNDRHTLLDALRARDSAVSLVVQACRAVGEKVSVINVLEAINANLELRLGAADSDCTSASYTTSGQETSRFFALVPSQATRPSLDKVYAHDTTAIYDERQLNKRRSLLILSRSRQASFETICSEQPSVISSLTSTLAFPSRDTSFSISACPDGLGADTSPRGLSGTLAMQARLDALSSLPLPQDAPADALRPFTLPARHSLAQLVNAMPEEVRARLGAYTLLEEETTVWCSDREEHGCFLVPAFRSFTHPRVATAHCWAKRDALGSLANTTHCFYQKDGKYYYAGAYVGVRLDDLDAEDWSDLPAETTRVLLKQTLADRSNLSPANNYETTQLYAAGALNVACVGLQCVGFDQEIASGILKCAEDLIRPDRLRPAPFHKTTSHGAPAAVLKSSIARHYSSHDELRSDKPKDARKHSF